MKRLAGLVLASVLGSTAASAFEGGVGVGSGSTGIGASLYADWNKSDFVQGLIGWHSDWGNYYCYGQVDYAQRFKSTQTAKGLSEYYGIGAFVDPRWHHGRYMTQDLQTDEFQVQTFAGVRVPIGVQLGFREIPIQISAEIVPGILLTPRQNLFFDIGANARYLIR